MSIEKKHILTSYERLSDEVMAEFQEAFPRGYEPYAVEVTKQNGERFYAVRLETEDAVYLIRVDLRVDEWSDDDDDDGDDDYRSESRTVDDSDDLIADDEEEPEPDGEGDEYEEK